MSKIATDNQHNILHLKGELNAHSLGELWSKQQTLLNNVVAINVADLVRVDSSGLAMLVYFCNRYNVKLIDVKAQLQTLIELYDLQQVLNE